MLLLQKHRTTTIPKDPIDDLETLRHANQNKNRNMQKNFAYCHYKEAHAYLLPL